MKSFVTRLTSLIAILVLSSCSLVKDIKIKELTDVSPRFENKEILLDAKLHVQNDNFYAVKLKHSDLKISIDDKLIGDVSLADKIVFKRKSDTIYPLLLKVKLADGAMFTLLRNAFKEEVTLKIKGTVKGSALGVPKTILVEEVKTIDAGLLKLFGN
jgi:LEA14-like dessication related protein